MNRMHAYRCAGLLAALLMLPCSVMPAAAEEDDDLIYLPVEDDKDSVETFECGDFVYSRLVNTNDETMRAACIEHYTGSDTDLEIPTELDGLQVVALGDYAFSGADTLEHVTIPETIINLGTYAFAECTMLQSFSVAEDNPCFTVIDGALYGNEGKELMRYPVGTRPKEITVPEGVISIGNVAFCNCKLLESVTFPSTLEYIGVAAFSDCDRLTEITIPEGVVELANFAFNSCKSLKSVSLPEGLYAIGDGAFAATALESVTIPESCQRIGQQAFAETKLKEVTIPAGVTNIGLSAFGWGLNAQNEMRMDESFVIYGQKGSAAENYASDTDGGNNFKFINIADDEEGGSDGGSTAPAPVPEDDGSIGIGRIIGIAICCLMLAGIAAAAIFTGKKKKSAAESEKPEEMGEPEDDADE